MGDIEEITVGGWAELNDALYEGAWQEPLGRFRSPVVYRGQYDARYTLTTSLHRMAGDDAAHLETPMLRAFRRYAHGHVTSGDPAIWNTLALAQHHGLPTRLLDWTHSPLVALHFATCDLRTHDRDAAIWCVDFGRMNRQLPHVLQVALQEEEAHVFTVEMLSRAASTLAEFDALSPAPFGLFFEPPSLDDRIVNQFALFSLLSSPTLVMDDWLRQQDAQVVRRIVVPAHLKPEVRDKLDQTNITERVLFPGLDGLSQWLTRYYTPRHPIPHGEDEPCDEIPEESR